MRSIMYISAALALCAGSTAGDGAVKVPILTMIAAFNKGDVALAKSTHVAAPMIVDEPTAPFAWSGPKAFDDLVGRAWQFGSEDRQDRRKGRARSFHPRIGDGRPRLPSGAVHLYFPTGETNNARDWHNDVCARQAGRRLEDSGMDVEQPRGSAGQQIAIGSHAQGW